MKPIASAPTMLKAFATCLALSAGVQLAEAQTYSNTTSGALNETVAPCSAPLIRTFSVSDTATLVDVDLSVLATHTYRGDIVTVLESPGGTRVQLTSSLIGRSGDNFNVTFDDAATATYVGASNTATHSTTLPYQNTLSPENPLSAFNGETANGTWTMEICDDFGQDSGTFTRADLTLTTGNTAPSADLSLTASASVTNPTTGSNTVLSFTVTNSGPADVDSITVLAALPSGLTYVSDTGGGAYDAASGVWTLPGTLTNGASTTLQVTANANASGSGAVLAEITASGLDDPDSTPDNRNTDATEDDTASLNLLINGPAPGTPPTLTCSGPQTVFDWDGENWTTGALSQSYPTSGVGLNFDFSGDTGFFVNNASFGGQSPARSSTISGGLSPAEQALLFVVNYTSSTQAVELEIDLGTAGEGVAAAQFTIFDVDINPSTANNANFIDRIRVLGYFGGAARTPILTGSTSNSVSGATATGTASVGSTSAAGNVTVTFDTPVDQVVIFYDNDPAVVPNPGQQGVAVHDITYCERTRDFSDAPASYGAPSHLIVPGISMGPVAPDAETAAIPSTQADGDDSSGVDDENAVSFPALTQGDATTLNVAVSGSGGYLRGWVDWDGDDTFETSELIADDLQPVGGSVSIPLSVPITATTSQTYARLRWSQQTGLGAEEAATSGEVEDFALTISPLTTATCPSGFIQTSSSGNADTVLVSAQFSSFALGPPESAGTTANSGNSARVNNGNRTLTLDLGDLVPEGSTIDVTMARDNGSGAATIELSSDNISFTTIQTFSGGSNDQLQIVPVTVPSGGARYIRFQRTSGRVWIAGMTYSEICTAAGGLIASKSAAVYDPGGAGDVFAIPGSDVIYTLTVTNESVTPAAEDSIVLIDQLPADVEFFNGTTPEFGNTVIEWTETNTTLTFDPLVDLGFADTVTGPPSVFADCTATVDSGYDADITHICFNPKGSMAAGDPDPTFSVRFRARIR
ncbi:MAG: GEVED domain-containing protein [Henriciella sp.]|nr:GEVED domain-containing protein [Henriciella sp.]